MSDYKQLMEIKRKAEFDLLKLERFKLGSASAFIEENGNILISSGEDENVIITVHHYEKIGEWLTAIGAINHQTKSQQK